VALEGALARMLADVSGEMLRPRKRHPAVAKASTLKNLGILCWLARLFLAGSLGGGHDANAMGEKGR